MAKPKSKEYYEKYALNITSLILSGVINATEICKTLNLSRPERVGYIVNRFYGFCFDEYVGIVLDRRCRLEGCDKHISQKRNYCSKAHNAKHNWRRPEYKADLSKKLSISGKKRTSNPDVLKKMIDGSRISHAKRWAAMTEEERIKNVSHLRIAYANCNPSQLHKDMWGKLSPEEKDKRIKGMIDGRDEWNKNPTFKHKSFKDIKCQSSYEYRFLEACDKLGMKLPIRGGLVETPIGKCFPDFEFPDRFVEIKSTWTYNEESNQYKRLKWINDNLKRVDILVIPDNVNIEVYLLNSITAFLSITQ